MPHSLTLEAIILKTHDVGEADRFCILLTRERGKLAARARGVRKPGSRMGGSLLHAQHVSLELHEGSAGFLITGAERISCMTQDSVEAFLQTEQAIELLLQTLHDDEPLPAVFDITLAFLARSDTSSEAVLPFTLSLLHLLGLLPSHNDPFFDRCSATQKEFIASCAKRQWEMLPDLSKRDRGSFSTLCAKLLTGVLSSPLNAGRVIGGMRA